MSLLTFGPVATAPGSDTDPVNSVPRNNVKEKRSISKVLMRALRLRCPACGESSIVKKPFQIKHHCPSCQSLFKREEGFFVGAILANVVITEFVILLTCFFWLMILDSNYETVLVALFLVALLFPVAFYHHSWSLWLGFDYLIESLPKYDPPSKTGRG
jgi:uncharacterized protein (DUF983 family)